MLVEGVGGLLVPLTDKETVADLINLLELPLLVVVGVSLGAINHTLLTLKVAGMMGIKIAGLVFNRCDFKDPESAEATGPEVIVRLSGAVELGRIPCIPDRYLDPMDWKAVRPYFEVGLDWPALQGMLK